MLHIKNNKKKKTITSFTYMYEKKSLLETCSKPNRKSSVLNVKCFQAVHFIKLLLENFNLKALAMLN